MEPNEYAIDLSALEVEAKRLERRMNKIERRISHFAMRYERLLIAKNETEVQIALRGVLCDECQERLDAREDADW